MPLCIQDVTIKRCHFLRLHQLCAGRVHNKQAAIEASNYCMWSSALYSVVQCSVLIFAVADLYCYSTTVTKTPKLHANGCTGLCIFYLGHKSMAQLRACERFRNIIGHFGDILWVRRPNQQCHGTEG